MATDGLTEREGHYQFEADHTEVMHQHRGQALLFFEYFLQPKHAYRIRSLALFYHLHAVGVAMHEMPPETAPAGHLEWLISPPEVLCIDQK